MIKNLRKQNHFLKIFKFHFIGMPISPDAISQRESATSQNQIK